VIEYNYRGNSYFFPYSNLSLYLDKKGWIFEKSKGDSKIYFNYLDSDFKVVIGLPDKNSHVLNNLLFHVFDTLSDFEQRTLEEILESISSIDKDVWKISISKGAKINSIDFNDVEKAIKNIKNLMLYSASAEQEARPYFEKPLATGDSFVKECKFGHTYAGSFGFTIITPVKSLDKWFDDKSLISRDRKINERIMRSFMLIRKEEEIIDITSVYENALNGNMCEAIIDLLRISKGDIECSINYSPIANVSSDIKDYSKIEIKHSNMSYIEGILKKLRQENEEINNFTIIGNIIELKHETTDEDNDYNILIIGDIEDKSKEKIHVSLKEGDYIKACELHKESIKNKRDIFVKISGNLRRSKKKWYLDSYHSFKEINDIRANAAVNDDMQQNLFNF